MLRKTVFSRLIASSQGNRRNAFPTTIYLPQVQARTASFQRKSAWGCANLPAFNSRQFGVTRISPSLFSQTDLWFNLAPLSYREMSQYPFCAEYAKTGQAKCKKCKEKIEKAVLRIGKISPNPFGEGDMKLWHHVDCIFEAFKKARATTKKIEDPIDDIDGWEDLEDDDRKKIQGLIDELQDQLASKKATPKKPTPQKKGAQATPNKVAAATPTKTATPSKDDAVVTRPPFATHKDNSFREFRRLCAAIAEESSYLEKTSIVSRFLKNGTEKDGFKGDLRLWVRLLLPGVIKRVYNLQSKQLIKLFSQILNTNQEEMLEDLEKGDIAETIRLFFEQSSMLPPIKKAVLTMHDVDEWLEELTGMTKEEEQAYMLKKMTKKCTGNDLKMVVRLIKGDLRINAGAKHILEAVHSDAYEAFQTTRNIDAIMDQIIQSNKTGETLKLKASVMTPVLPMLAEACKSVEYAFKKCLSGAMFSEIKYDGERVQVHKTGAKFMYFSRSLKPVVPHKVSHFKDYIPKAFPHGKDLILDAEVLMVDNKTGNPLPFGTLGIHKKSAFADANVCLFVFDCLHYNGEDLMDKPIWERKKILEKTMVEIKNHVMFSEMKEIRKKDDLRDMINRVLKQGLEGLVLKDINSVYEPGKRHWLKVKKDYLNDGAMADTADLVVMGAWYGTGKKGGMMSVFLMGCYDSRINKWCTVTKVHTGHDDAALARLQTQLDVVKISQDVDRVPLWLKCTKTMTPDFVVVDPKKSPVWEITGAEFTRHQIHTADGISIRFPRVTKVRDDKSWEQATNLAYLQELYKKSREYSDIDVLASDKTDDNDDGEKQSGGSGTSTPVKGPAGGSGTSTPVKGSASPSPDKAKRKEKLQKTLSAFMRVEPKEEEEKENTKKKHNVEPKEEEEETENTKKKRSEKQDRKTEKRKSDEVAADEPSKKVCKYGASCYNTNVAHLHLYKHPQPLSPKPPTKNLLPDVFQGLQIGLPDTVEKMDVMKRYIIAYGGDIVPEYIAHQATHLVVDDKDVWQTACRGQRVKASWVWDSIKLQSLQPTRPYLVSRISQDQH